MSHHLQRISDLLDVTPRLGNPLMPNAYRAHSSPPWFYICLTTIFARVTVSFVVASHAGSMADQWQGVKLAGCFVVAGAVDTGLVRGTGRVTGVAGSGLVWVGVMCSSILDRFAGYANLDGTGAKQQQGSKAAHGLTPPCYVGQKRRRTHHAQRADLDAAWAQ